MYYTCFSLGAFCVWKVHTHEEVTNEPFEEAPIEIEVQNEIQDTRTDNEY